MSLLPHARSFKELIVYQKSREMAKEVFRLTKRFPREEIYSLTDQVRRCSRSIGGQIAEAWAKRRYEKHFVSKLADADGEQLETQHWLLSAFDCEYISAEELDALTGKLEEIGRMLNSMIEKSDLFCGQNLKAVRENGPEYFINTDH